MLARALLLGLVVPLVGACSGSGGETTDPVATDGPVQFAGADVEQRASMRTGDGQQAVFGATTVENNGTSTVTFSGADLVGDVDSTAATVVEVRVVQLGRAPGTGDLLGAGAWPDPEWATWWDRADALEGAHLAPGAAAEVVFIVSVDRPGDWVWPQTSVDYVVGDSSYRAVTDFGFQVCAPEPAPCSELHATR